MLNKIATQGEVRRIRRALKKTPSAFARLIGLDVEVIRSWEVGEKRPSRVATKVMRVMTRNKVFLRELEKMA